MKKNNKGFTLAELLIVVAIIAVLVAIAIPIFTGQLEKSREATDLANVRSAYAEVMVAAISEDKSSAAYQSDGQWSATVDLVQRKDGWTTKTPLNIGGVESAEDGGTNAAGTWIGLPEARGTCEVSYSASDGIKFIWSGSSGGGSGSGGESGGSGSGGDDGGSGSGGGSDTPAGTGSSWPEQGTTASLKKGHVYTYDNKSYVVTADRDMNQYYYVTPDDAPWLVIELKSDARVRTLSECDSENNNQIIDLQKGDIFRYDDGTTYIRSSDSTHGQDPRNDNSANWVEIINS